jgi:hypothetical protein
MPGTEFRTPVTSTQLLFSSVQSPYRPLRPVEECKAYTFPPVGEQPRLRQGIVSLERWLDLNA